MKGAEFLRNVAARPPEALLPYRDQHVAWSEDGREILAHAATLETLIEEVARRGFGNVVFDFVPGEPRLGSSAKLADAKRDGHESNH